MKNNDIEDLFKKSFENYEAEVNPGVWKNVRIGLKWGGLALFFNTIINKMGTTAIVALVSSAAVVIISTIALMNKPGNTTEKAIPAAVETKETPVAAIEKPTGIASNNEESRAIGQNLANSTSDLNQTVENANSNLPTKLVQVNSVGGPIKEDKTESVTNKAPAGPIASISASPVVGTAPLIVNLANKGTGKTNKWAYNDGKKDKPTSDPIHIFETPGIYSVILTSTNANGVTASDSIKVEVTGPAPSVPKEFSPNGDGVLDEFVFQTKNIAKMSAKIIDKKGITVYKSDSIDAKWDGKDLQGNDANEGVYYYIINAEGIDGKKYDPKGSINLTR